VRCGYSGQIVSIFRRKASERCMLCENVFSMTNWIAACFRTELPGVMKGAERGLSGSLSSTLHSRCARNCGRKATIQEGSNYLRRRAISRSLEDFVSALFAFFHTKAEMVYRLPKANVVTRPMKDIEPTMRRDILAFWFVGSLVSSGGELVKILPEQHSVASSSSVSSRFMQRTRKIVK